MSDAPRLAVVGCGIFGAEVALAARATGFDVTIFEALPDILLGASHNNQNRLHQGFHYPRDLETGHQSLRGFAQFVARYPDCVRSDFQNIYFVADEGSKTTPAAFLEFCEALGAPYDVLEPSQCPVEVRGASTAVQCSEVVYDSALLRHTIRLRLAEAGVKVRTGTKVVGLAETSSAIEVQIDSGGTEAFDAVVNCSYADNNRLTAKLGHSIPEREYEYTVVPIIEWDVPRTGITVMDGPFLTILPFGKSDRFLLYTVENSVVARETGAMLNPDWLSPASAPFVKMDADRHFEAMVQLCAAFVPALKSARVVGHLEGPRMVLARNDATDARPSLVTPFSDRYMTVFSGKVDHSIWVAQEVADSLKARFRPARLA